MVRLGAEAGLEREWGPPTQETGLRNPCKPLHDLDGIPQLYRALQLGLGWVGWWQVAIAGQPVLGHRRERVKREGWEGWDSAFPLPSSKPHLSPGIRNPGPPAPGACSLLPRPPHPRGPKVLAFQTWVFQSLSGPKGPGPHLPIPVPFQIFRSLSQT